MTGRHNVTMQFVGRRSYKRLCVLAHVWGKTLGDTIMKLLDEDEGKTAFSENTAETMDRKIDPPKI